MLKLRPKEHLASRLGITLDEIFHVMEHHEDYCEEFYLIDPKKPDKKRRVLNVRGKLRRLQNRIHDSLLATVLRPSLFSHGCVRGRSIRTNITPHLKNTFVLTADISNFFPSIHYTRVYRLFVGRLMCSPDVSHILARLCTYNYHLALGLITSPILANEIIRPIDDRISAVCRTLELSYTRYVDDITISGPFDFEHSGILKSITTILKEHSLKLNSDKTHIGRTSDSELTITGIQIRNGRPDVPKAYLEETIRQIKDAESLSLDGSFEGPYYTESQILGRVRFICWVNRRWKERLRLLISSVNWNTVASEASKRGLVQRKPVLFRVPPTGNLDVSGRELKTASL